MNDKSQVESILNDIRSMVNNVIIKLSYQADMYETTDIKREADRYIAAYLEKDTFDSYRAYPMDVIAKAGISNLNDLTAYSSDRNKIPREKRKDVLKAMRETVIREYVEMNDYYRELIGMPSINTPEEEWIYLTEEEMKYYEIDEVRPIHEYPKEIQHKLERDLIPNLIKLYPERTYLQHMGSKAVNLVRARQARNFDIIFTDIKLDTVFMRAFFETYDFAREYFMGLIYNKAFKERYDLYDNYMGMHIMIMTVQRLVVDTIKMGIDRDFYDLISIKKLFNVYGVPFFEDLPLDYQRTIVKNVNMLIRSKSTDKVLYDIANTLFYERVRIYKYFLVRERKFDEDGNPIFLYKEEIRDTPPEKYYIKSNNKKTYELAVQGNRLVTIECQVPYAPEAIYMKDEVTGEMFKLFMKDDVIVSAPVEDKNQICQSVIMYNENFQKFKLAVDKDVIETEEIEYNRVTVYDYEHMYDVYFQATDIMERNVISTLETKYNRYAYDEVVKDDVYWWETEELKKELFGRDYTYIDTKYISVTVMQNLTKMLYETVYYLNMLVDHKNTTVPMLERVFNSDAMKYGTDYLYLDLDRITTVPVSIFDSVMILCALVAKKNGMKGNIIVESPSKILSVLGFNFEANFELIRENIRKYKRVFKNQEILKYLDLLDIRSVKDIDTLFNNFKNFAEFCADVVATTTDINEYKAYKELYKVITVRKDATKLFTMTDGNVANTYLEYLYDKLPVVADFIDNMHKDKTGVFIEHVLGKLNELIPEIEYLNTINGTNNNIVQAILGLINFFKSYTVDLRTLNILYMFDNRMLNKIYMIDDPRLFVKLYPTESYPLYTDSLRPIVMFDKQDNLVIYDPSRLGTRLRPSDSAGMYDEIEQLLMQLGVEDELVLSYKDMMEMINNQSIDDIIDLRENNALSTRLIADKDKFVSKHSLILKNLLAILDSLELEYKDLIGNSHVIFTKISQLKLKLQHETLINIDNYENWKSRDVYSIGIGKEAIDSLLLDYKDVIKDLSNIIREELKLNLIETDLTFISQQGIDKLTNNDKYNTCVELGKDDAIELLYNDDINMLKGNMKLSNADIYINDSVKVTYED